jgi:hypothetical protein
VAVEGMTDYIAVFDGCRGGGDGFAVDVDCAGFHGSFLGVSVDGFVSYSFGSTYIVLLRPVPELVSEDLEDLAAAPSLLAVRVVCEVVWRDSSEAVFQVVGSWPGITGCDGDFRRRSRCWRGFEAAQI